MVNVFSNESLELNSCAMFSQDTISGFQIDVVWDTWNLIQHVYLPFSVLYLCIHSCLPRSRLLQNRYRSSASENWLYALGYQSAKYWYSARLCAGLIASTRFDWLIISYYPEVLPDWPTMRDHVIYLSNALNPESLKETILLSPDLFRKESHPVFWPETLGVSM